MRQRGASDAGDPFPFEDYGFRVGGPLVSGMVDWMVGQMRTDPPEKIFFLARDGQIVQEVWQRRVPSDLSGIPTHYLLASRRALCMAAIRSLDTPALDFLTKTPFGLTPPGLLKRVGLQKDAADPCENPSLRPWRYETLPPAERSVADAFLRRYEKPLLARADEERTAYCAYLREILVDRPARIAVVDIGWHGSLQTALGNLLKTEPCAPTHLDGYYLGLFREAAAERPGIPGERLGFLLQNGTPDGRQSELQRFVEILEIFFASPEPTLLHFRCDETGSARPVFAPSEHSPAQSRAIRAIRAGILRFAETRRAPVSAREAFAGARRLGLSPTREEASAFGRFLLPRGFGESAPLRALAATGHPAANLLFWSRFVSRFKTALWRTGFWAQLGTPERYVLSILSPQGSRALRSAQGGDRPREKP
jgi:hypothetical protein